MGVGVGQKTKFSSHKEIEHFDWYPQSGARTFPRVVTIELHIVHTLIN